MSRRLASGWTLFFMVASLSACDTEDKTPATQPAAEVPVEAVKKPPPPPVKGPPLSAIAARAAKRAAGLKARDKATLKGLLKKVRHDGPVLKHLYKSSKLQHYTADGTLSESGDALLALLADLERHGVDRRPYRLADIDAATAAVVAAFRAERTAAANLGSDVGAAKVAMAAAAWTRGGPGGEIVLVKASGGKLSGAARKGLGDGLDKVMDASIKVRQAMWRADVAMSAAAVRYVIDFTMAKPAHPHEYISPGTLRKNADAEAEALIARFDAHKGAQAKTMKAAWPTHPQYKRLLKAVDAYKRLADKGGWELLPPLGRKKIEKGGKGPFVLALRKRLLAEGYELPADGERFDKPVHHAVVEFQRRHQLKEDGGVGKGTIAALDVTAEQRVRQLKLALTRWRSALARDAEGFYAHVNVAAQRVKLYDKNKRIREHRVIVGKDNDDIDYDKRIKGKINRTKLFSAKMKRITLAPRWYPTPRVIDLELGPALAKDPDYFEKHGYVSEMQADGSEKVYQRAGKSNLLGVVKFQFPNKHAIYMHDTPGRALFKRARRAYSHGCVRLHKPKQLAYYLLKRDRGWKRKKIDEIIKKREEKIVGLRKHFWVYIDYISATVDDDGTTRFWSDIYAYDLAYFTGQLPVQETEEYKAASTRGL
ncbi:MAG: L,D-transpeptidase family protein [Myxococcales bacterium]|nr:L,D-transpeptidase family protein [Myxococcales bacterium]